MSVTDSKERFKKAFLYLYAVGTGISGMETESIKEEDIENIRPKATPLGDRLMAWHHIFVRYCLKNVYPRDRIAADKYDDGGHLLAYWRNIYPEFLEAMFNHKVTGLKNGELIDEARLSAGEETESSVHEGPGGDYIYYDNSGTKWEKVYAYWWEKCFSTTTNKLTGEAYGEAFPGLPMERVGDTDIYRIVIPVKATSIIFNSGASDEEIRKDIKAYQTADLEFSDTAIAGQVYKIDLSQAPENGRGVEKTKYVYPAGSWSDHTP